jgi:DNA (cytosine-5)-methyltransferase 1
MIVGGVLYPLRPLERYTSAKGGFYLPTPRAKIGNDCPSERRRNDPSWDSLIGMGFPTPQASDASKGPAKEYIPNGKQASMRNLVTLIARFQTKDGLLPTPTAKGSASGNRHNKNAEYRPTLPAIAKFQTTGKILNPQFVGWLMGYPIGWTELEDWAMQWFRNKRKKRSKS